MADAHKNLAISAVATAPSPATSGTSLVVTAGHGTRFPAAPFNATIGPASTSPDPLNAEIVRVTVVSTDTLTITRAQESTSARTVIVGDVIYAGSTAKSFTDIETEKTNVAIVPNTAPAAGQILVGNAGGTAYAPVALSGAVTMASTGVVTAKVELERACSDENTAITSGTAKLTFRMPFAMTLTAIRVNLKTAPTGSTFILDLNEGGTTVLSTKCSVDISEKTSVTAAAAAVISDSALADDAEMTVDFDQVGSTVAGAGVKLTLYGTRI